MPAICEGGDAEERLIVNVGIAVDGVSNSRPKLDAIDRVADIRASGRDLFWCSGIYCDIHGLH